MKKLILLFTLLLSVVTIAQAKGNKNAKANFEVSGNCEMCKMRIEKATLSVSGVKFAKWSIPENQLTLVYNSNRVKLLEIHNSIALSGHDTSVKDAPTDTYNDLPICCLYVREEKSKAPFK